jgi:hypothetical protein
VVKSVRYETTNNNWLNGASRYTFVETTSGFNIPLRGYVRVRQGSKGLIKHFVYENKQCILSPYEEVCFDEECIRLH